MALTSMAVALPKHTVGGTVTLTADSSVTGNSPDDSVGTHDC
jgi:hypothetical protein